MKNNIVTTILFLACCYTVPTHAFKVLFIVGSFPALSEIFILNQITGFIDRCHDVYIYARDHGATDIMPPQVEEYALLNRTFYGSLPQNFGVDIVMCQFGTLFSTYTTLKKRCNLQSHKVVTFFRGSDVGVTLTANRHAYDTTFKESDLLFPNCAYFKNILTHAGCDPEKIIVHHSAIDCSKFAFKPRSINSNEPIHIVTTARLVEKKGLEYAIRAVALVKEKYPNVTYTIIGGGSLEKALTDLIASLNLQDTVHLVGRQTQDYVARALDTAHLFILASITARDGNLEGIPNALKEAMAMGIPVIGTYHSGNPELIINGKSGFLVPEKDVAALAETIEYIIEHPEGLSTLCKAARDKVEQEFETEQENDKLVTILQELLASKYVKQHINNRISKHAKQPIMNGVR